MALRVKERWRSQQKSQGEEITPELVSLKVHNDILQVLGGGLKYGTRRLLLQ